MTAFGIYLVFYWLANVLAGMYYIGKGELVSTRGGLIGSVLWQIFNIIGLFVWGTGLGVF